MYTQNKIQKLAADDSITEVLEVMYNNTEDPSMRILSKMLLGMSRKDVIRMCTLFGGCILRIPTLQELRIYAAALYIYNKGGDAEILVHEFPAEIRREILEIYGKLR